MFSCSLKAQSVTAHINNTLVEYTPNIAPSESEPQSGDSLLEGTWQSLIEAILYVEAHGFLAMPAGWLEDILSSTLSSPTASGGQPLKLDAFEHTLSSVSTLAYALASQTWSRNFNTSVSPGGGSLIHVDVTQPHLAGQVHVNALQLFFGLGSVIIMGYAIASMLWGARREGTGVSGRNADPGTNMMRGGLLDFALLLRNSSLPRLFAWKPQNSVASKTNQEKAQRKLSERLIVE